MVAILDLTEILIHAHTMDIATLTVVMVIVVGFHAPKTTTPSMTKMTKIRVNTANFLVNIGSFLTGKFA